MDNGKLGFTRELYNYYFDYKLPVGKKVHVEIVTATQKTTLKVDGETIGEAGKLGFTRELYNYYFDYKLPVGKKVHVEIVTATQKTTLKVDGETIGEATGSFYNEFAKRVTKDGIGNSTFTLPLQRIGSKIRGIAAEIDNIKVAPASKDKPVDQYNKAKWQARTNSWTQTGESAGGHLSHALDGNPSTIWHSNWQSVTAENVNGDLKVSKMIYAEFDFDKGYDITQFFFTPRGDVGSGFITKATLKVKNTANGEYKTVATDQVFRADSKKKTFTFDEQTVYGVRLEITDANEHGGHKYVAVSEFDIANTPARTNTVYAHGKSYAAGTDGALDLATGKAAGQIAGSAEDLDASKPVYRAEVKGGTTVTLTAEQVDGLEFVGWLHRQHPGPHQHRLRPRQELCRRHRRRARPRDRQGRRSDRR